MKKWPLLFALTAVIVIGCNGGGGDNGFFSNPTSSTTASTGITTATTATTGRSNQFVNIPNKPAIVDTYFLPGQGRAPGTITAEIGRTNFTDVNGLDMALENPIPPSIFLQLDAYNAQNRTENATVPAPGGPNSQSRQFKDLSIQIRNFIVTDGQGGSQTLGGLEVGATNVLNMTAYQGRTTALQIFLNDAMVKFNPNAVFNQNLFITANTDPVNGKITGFLSDYVMFDITNVANKPHLADGTPAAKIYASGDFFALSVGGNTGKFEVLTSVGVYDGKFFPPDPIVQLKTYQLDQPDPSSPFPPPRMVTALKGVFFNFQERVNVTDATLFLTFPKTGDGKRQDAIIIQHSGASISAMYFGTVNYGAAAGPTFTAFPIGDIQPASVAGQISGTVSGFATASGTPVLPSGATWWQNVRTGNWNVTSGSGAGIASSGKFYVYRL